MFNQWVHIHCQTCDTQAEELLEDFSKDAYREKGWKFNVYDEPENSDPVRESDKQWFISGLCPECGEERPSDPKPAFSVKDYR